MPPTSSHIQGPKGFVEWASYQLSSTIIDEIFVQTLFFAGWTSTITCVQLLTNYDLAVSSILLTTLGTLISFVISLRTNSAYDRYYEGRRCWSGLSVASRTLTSLIWIHVLDERPSKDNPTQAEHDEYALKSVLEKRSIIRVIEAFGIATKHYLRGETGVYYEDLYPLIKFLPSHCLPSSIEERHDVNLEKLEHLAPLWHSSHHTGVTFIPFQPPSKANTLEVLNEKRPFESKNVTFTESFSRDTSKETISEEPVDLDFIPTPEMYTSTPQLKHTKTFSRSRATIELLPSRNPPKRSIYNCLPFLIVLRPLLHFVAERVFKIQDPVKLKRFKKRPIVESHIPLELCLFLSSYVASIKRRQLADLYLADQIFNQLNRLQESLVALERIVSTPLPYSYVIHIKVVVWVFLLLVPFQVVSALGWISIPGVTIAAFMFLGFLELGRIIEDPFGYDFGDLDLDDFCSKISREAAEIVATPPYDPALLILNSSNTPLIPSDPRNAKQLLRSGMANVRRSLATHYRVLNETHVKTRLARAKGYDNLEDEGIEEVRRRRHVEVELYTA